MSSPDPLPFPPGGNTTRTSSGASGWRFLVDESMPRLLTNNLRGAGYDVEDGRDVGLRSQPDSVVFVYAQTKQRTIVTLDVGQGSVTTYPTPHAGIIVARLPDSLSMPVKVAIIMRSLATLTGQSFADCIVTIDPGRVRVRRA